MNVDGRKISRQYEAVVDNFLIDGCEPVATKLHDFSFTPNMITTIGLVFGVFAVISLYEKRYVLSVILLWIAYWFDCLDGYYARKYNMETQLGDYYDHFRDIFVISAFVIILMIKLKMPYNIFFVASIAIAIYLMLCQIGCQEKNSNYKNANKMLSVFKNLCPSRQFIRISRLAGCSTMVMVITIFAMIAALQHHPK